MVIMSKLEKVREIDQQEWVILSEQHCISTLIVGVLLISLDKSLYAGLRWLKDNVILTKWDLCLTSYNVWPRVLDKDQ